MSLDDQWLGIELQTFVRVLLIKWRRKPADSGTKVGLCHYHAMRGVTNEHIGLSLSATIGVQNIGNHCSYTHTPQLGWGYGKCMTRKCTNWKWRTKSPKIAGVWNLTDCKNDGQSSSRTSGSGKSRFPVFRVRHFQVVYYQRPHQRAIALCMYVQDGFVDVRGRHGRLPCAIVGIRGSWVRLQRRLPVRHTEPRVETQRQLLRMLSRALRRHSDQPAARLAPNSLTSPRSGVARIWRWGVWGTEVPQRGPGAEPLVGGSGGTAPRKLIVVIKDIWLPNHAQFCVFSSTAQPGIFLWTQFRGGPAPPAPGYASESTHL